MKNYQKSMSALDYYRKFCEKLDISLYECEYLDSYDANLYLYVLEKDTFTKPQRITIFTSESEYEELFIYGSHAKNNTYIIFIPVNEYMFVWIAEPYIHLYIYSDDSSYIALTGNAIFMFLDWLDMSELKRKVLKGQDFLMFNLKLFENSSFDGILDNEYIGKCKSTIYKLVDWSLDKFAYSFNKNAYYSVYDEFKKSFYINIQNKPIINDFPIGKYAGSFYYFELDNERSFLLIAYETYIIIVFYKDNKIAWLNQLTVNLELWFKLIGREDMFALLKEHHLFIREN